MMENKTILIGGCSYSESQKKFRFVKNETLFHNHAEYDPKKNWYPWTDMLDDEYGSTNTIINEAKGSSGQGMIVSKLTKKLFELDFKVDLVIAQWSNPSRMFTDKESDIVEAVRTQGLEMLSVKGIDIFTKESKERMDMVGYDITFNSLNQIYLFKNLLESKGIKYKFFWGWQQNINYEKYRFILDEIYSKDFMLFVPEDENPKREGGGMHDYANMILGSNNTEVEDGHPNTESHRIFYNDIIKNKILKGHENNFI